MTDTSNPTEQATSIFLAAAGDLETLKAQNTQLITDKSDLLQQVATLQQQIADEVQKNSGEEAAVKAANDLAATGQTAFNQFKQSEEADKAALSDAIARLNQQLSAVAVADPLPAAPTVAVTVADPTAAVTVADPLPADPTVAVTVADPLPEAPTAPVTVADPTAAVAVDASPVVQGIPS